MYQVNTTEVFKGEDEPEVEYDVSMTFDLATGGNSALCGINMDEGEEYLIDLYRDDFNGGRLYAAGSCGLVRPWRSVSPDDQALLREGCEGYDPCDGACGPYQVKVIFVRENSTRDEPWKRYNSFARYAVRRPGER